jgi:hypothetical protein
LYATSNFHRGAGAEPQLHDRQTKQQHAEATTRAAFPRYLYNPDQGHDTFYPPSSQRAPSQRVHAAQQVHKEATVSQHHNQLQQQQEQQQHYHQEQLPPVAPEPAHGGGSDETVSLPPLPSPPVDDASFTLFR